MALTAAVLSALQRRSRFACSFSGYSVTPLHAINIIVHLDLALGLYKTLYSCAISYFGDFLLPYRHTER